MNKRKIIIFFLILFVVLLTLSISYIWYNYSRIEILNVKLIKYDEKEETMKIRIKRVANKFNNVFVCHIDGESNHYEVFGKNNKCELTINSLDSYSIYLTNDKGDRSSVIKLNDSLNAVLNFEFNVDTIYLIPEEEYAMSYHDVIVGNKIDYNFKSENENIAKYDNNKIIAVTTGETYIYSDKVNKKLKVIVNDLLTKPYAIKDKKDILPCDAYTEEEANLLDNILEYKIKNAGYQTRAGAVAAARFLTLEFKYRVPYYYETGRIGYDNSSCKYPGKNGYTNINTNFADGEGRYYHKGLYLSNTKKSDIQSSVKGPQIWGCSLMNVENKPEYGFYPGKMVPNGLDCSGFVTWSLKNAGYEPGDIGAGEDPGRDCQCTDLGKFVSLKSNIDNMKAGDLLNWWGHIAMFIGFDGENYYVAESLSYIGGVRAMIYTRQELLNTFKYTVVMDDFYKEEGNYSLMWN